MIKKITLLLPLFLWSILLSAQQTGSFQQAVTFNEPDYNFTRTLYFHVPDDYDSSQSYKLVVGFRGGPHSNAGQFRDQLTFLSDSIEAIILCPENEGHFWNQEGLTKQLFQYALDTTMAMYNIDPEFIYLTGLSYGGRHAVIVSMDTDDGSIPNLRGVIPFAAGTDSQLAPNYEAIANFAPACVCIGLSDASNFINVSNSLHNDIIANGGKSFLNEISGVGHTVAFPTYPQEMMECLTFIESQYQITDLKKIPLDERISIFPNPTTNTIQFSYPQSLNPNKVYITDSSGNLLLNLSKTQKQVDVSALSSGIKLLIIDNGEEIFVKRLLVMH